MARGVTTVVAACIAAFLAGACGSGGGAAHQAAVVTTTPTTAAPTTVASAAPTTPGLPTTSTTAAPPSPPSPASPASLQQAVDATVAGRPVPFGVVAVDEVTGERAEHLAGRQVWSASLYKLFVARELLRRIVAGTLTRGQPIGDPEGRTVGQCLEAMIVVSDDDCGVAGLAMVGRGRLDAALHAEGYVSTALDTPQRTSAADVALFLERVRAGTLLGEAAGDAGRQATAELHALLARQQVADRFPQGLPPGTPLAHKTGDRTGWAHDAGIITRPGGGDVLLVVVTGPWPSPCCHAERPGPAERAAFAAIASVARDVYAFTTRPR